MIFHEGSQPVPSISGDHPRLPYVQSYKSSGRQFYYFRKGSKLVRLRGEPGTDEFLASYQLAKDGPPQPLPTQEQIRKARLAAIDAERAEKAKKNFVRIILNNAAGRAKKRGLPFSLKPKDIELLIEFQHGRCAVSGLRFDFTPAAEHEQYAPWRPSLDRFDNSKGYELGNVRIVCTIANFAMGQWGETTLLKLARAMVALNT